MFTIYASADQSGAAYESPITLGECATFNEAARCVTDQMNSSRGAGCFTIGSPEGDWTIDPEGFPEIAPTRWVRWSDRGEIVARRIASLSPIAVAGTR